MLHFFAIGVVNVRKTVNLGMAAGDEQRSWASDHISA
jgi:hypothetical protein